MVYIAVNNIVHFREIDTTLSEKVIKKNIQFPETIYWLRGNADKKGSPIIWTNFSNYPFQFQVKFSEQNVIFNSALRISASLWWLFTSIFRPLNLSHLCFEKTQKDHFTPNLPCKNWAEWWKLVSEGGNKLLPTWSFLSLTLLLSWWSLFASLEII